MDFVLKRCEQVVFDWTQAFSFILRYNKDEKPRPKSVPSKKFLAFWDGDKCYFFEISSYLLTVHKTDFLVQIMALFYLEIYMKRSSDIWGVSRQLSQRAARKP